MEVVPPNSFTNENLSCMKTRLKKSTVQYGHFSNWTFQKTIPFIFSKIRVSCKLFNSLSVKISFLLFLYSLQNLFPFPSNWSQQKKQQENETYFTQSKENNLSHEKTVKLSALEAGIVF